MKLSAMIPAEAIIEELASTEKQAVLEEMVGVLVELGRIAKDSAASVVKALMKREELGSTGIGKGVAVPHAKHESIGEPVAAFGRSSKGIEFAALDGQPVRLVFLLLSSKDNSGQHLEALAGVARLVKDDKFCRFLRHAKGREGLAELLAEADSQQDDAAGAAPAG
ncbi:MAG: PTS sugar transporter subunit IIA [Planctomycetota bacterium]